MQLIIAWDLALSRRLRGKPQGLRWLMLGLTVLGEPAIIMPLFAAGGVLAAAEGEARDSLVLLLACLGAVLNLGLNFAIRRQRPSTPFARAMFVKTYSFPSEHAFTALLAFGLLAYAGFAGLPLAAGLATALLLAGCAFGVGFSRVYLGAHFVLDVLAGWLLGAGVLALLIRLLR